MTKPYDIPKALVWEAYQYKTNGGPAGIDHESLEQFESHLSGNLYKLWNRMCSGSYLPPPVKGVPIPKKSGGDAHHRQCAVCPSGGNLLESTLPKNGKR